jgi:hypothetical protein
MRSLVGTIIIALSTAIPLFGQDSQSPRDIQVLLAKPIVSGTQAQVALRMSFPWANMGMRSFGEAMLGHSQSESCVLTSSDSCRTSQDPMVSAHVGLEPYNRNFGPAKSYLLTGIGVSAVQQDLGSGGKSWAAYPMLAATVGVVLPANTRLGASIDLGYRALLEGSSLTGWALTAAGLRFALD